jgi:hypothetical protein
MPTTLALFRSALRRPVMAIVLLASCHSLVDLPLPPDAEEMTPPPVYATWWAMTEACSGISAPLERIRWYVVPNALTVPYPGNSNVAGYWSLASDRILLAGTVALDGEVVRHEMLHALARVGGHPRAYFLDRCGGVVDCLSDCVSDGGPPPAFDPATPRIAATSLQPTITVFPTSPSRLVDDGFFTVTVSVTNTADHPVRAVTSDSNALNLGTTFVYRVMGPFGGRSNLVRPHDPGALRFAAHETKRQVFDFRVGSDVAAGDFRPGTYLIGGAFGWLQPLTDVPAILRP